MKSKFLLLVLAALPLAAVTQAATPPKDLISEKKATEIAVKAAPGSVTSSELEFERKLWVYSFDIKGSDNQIHEVLVNAKTGGIVANSVESAAEEAKEANEDDK